MRWHLLVYLYVNVKLRRNPVNAWNGGKMTAVKDACQKDLIGAS
ncbi:TPA: hypothetical protein ACID1H_005349 [Pseudomonas aeruginosa]